MVCDAGYGIPPDSGPPNGMVCSFCDPTIAAGDGGCPYLLDIDPPPSTATTVLDGRAEGEGRWYPAVTDRYPDGALGQSGLDGNIRPDQTTGFEDYEYTGCYLHENFCPPSLPSPFTGSPAQADASGEAAFVYDLGGTAIATAKLDTGLHAGVPAVDAAYSVADASEVASEHWLECEEGFKLSGLADTELGAAVTCVARDDTTKNDADGGEWVATLDVTSTSTTTFYTTTFAGVPAVACEPIDAQYCAPATNPLGDHEPGGVNSPAGCGVVGTSCTTARCLAGYSLRSDDWDEWNGYLTCTGRNVILDATGTYTTVAWDPAQPGDAVGEGNWLYFNTMDNEFAQSECSPIDDFCQDINNGQVAGVAATINPNFDYNMDFSLGAPTGIDMEGSANIDCNEGYSYAGATRNAFDCRDDNANRILSSGNFKQRFGILETGASYDGTPAAPVCAEIPDFCAATTELATAIGTSAGTVNSAARDGGSTASTTSWRCADGYSIDGNRESNPSTVSVSCRESGFPTAGQARSDSGVWTDGTSDANGYLAYECTAIDHYCCIDSTGVDCPDGSQEDPEADATHSSNVAGIGATVTRTCNVGFGLVPAEPHPDLDTSDYATTGTCAADTIQSGVFNWDDNPSSCEPMLNYCPDPTNSVLVPGGSTVQTRTYDNDDSVLVANGAGIASETVAPFTSRLATYQVTCDSGFALNPETAPNTPTTKAAHAYSIQCQAETTGQRWGVWKVFTGADTLETDPAAPQCTEIPYYCPAPNNAEATTATSFDDFTIGAVRNWQCAEGMSLGGVEGGVASGTMECMSDGTDTASHTFTVGEAGDDMIGYWEDQGTGSEVDCAPALNLCPAIVAGGVLNGVPTDTMLGWQSGDTATLECADGSTIASDSTSASRFTGANEYQHVEVVCVSRIDGGLVTGEWKLVDDNGVPSDGDELQCVEDPGFCVDDNTGLNRAAAAAAQPLLAQSTVDCDVGYSRTGTEGIDVSHDPDVTITCAYEAFSSSTTTTSTTTNGGLIEGRYVLGEGAPGDDDTSCTETLDYCNLDTQGLDATRDFSMAPEDTVLTGTTTQTCDAGYAFDARLANIQAQPNGVTDYEDSSVTCVGNGVAGGLWENSNGAPVANDDCRLFALCDKDDFKIVQDNMFQTPASPADWCCVQYLGHQELGDLHCNVGEYIWDTNGAGEGFWERGGDVRKDEVVRCVFEGYTGTGALTPTYSWRSVDDYSQVADDVELQPKAGGGPTCEISNYFCPGTYLAPADYVVHTTNQPNSASATVTLSTPELQFAELVSSTDRSYLDRNEVRCESGYGLFTQSTELSATRADVECLALSGAVGNVAGQWISVDAIGTPAAQRLMTCGLIDGYCLADGTALNSGTISDVNLPAGRLDSSALFCCDAGYQIDAANTQVPVYCGEFNGLAYDDVYRTDAAPWLADRQDPGSAPTCTLTPDFCRIDGAELAESDAAAVFANANDRTLNGPAVLTLTCNPGYTLADAATERASDDFQCQGDPGLADGCSSGVDTLNGNLYNVGSATGEIAACTRLNEWCNLGDVLVDLQNAEAITAADLSLPGSNNFYPVGTVLTVTCEPGYILDYAPDPNYTDQWTCQPDRSWDLAGATCVPDPTYCAADRATLDGLAAPNGVTFSDSAAPVNTRFANPTLSCDEAGYTFDGESTAIGGEFDLVVVCRPSSGDERTGEWQSASCTTGDCTLPLCEPQEQICDSGLVAVADAVLYDCPACGRGSAVASQPGQDDVASLWCDYGFELAAATYTANVVCQWSGVTTEPGVWVLEATTTASPVCSRTPGYCPALPAGNGAPSSATARIDDTVTFTCSDGYEVPYSTGTLSGALTCMEAAVPADGPGSGVWQWDAAAAETVIDCVARSNYCPATVPGAAFHDDASTVNAQANVEGAVLQLDCLDGYWTPSEATADISVQCGPTGSWVLAADGVTPVQCNLRQEYCPRSLPNTDSIVLGDTALTGVTQVTPHILREADINCLQGADLNVNNADVVCTAGPIDGVWTAQSTPAECIIDTNYCPGDVFVAVPTIGGAQPVPFSDIDNYRALVTADPFFNALCNLGYSQDGVLGGPNGGTYRCDASRDFLATADSSPWQQCVEISNYCVATADVATVDTGAEPNVVTVAGTAACSAGTTVGGQLGGPSSNLPVVCSPGADASSPGVWREGSVAGPVLVCTEIQNYCSLQPDLAAEGALAVESPSPLGSTTTYDCDEGALAGGAASQNVECVASNSYELEAGGGAVVACAAVNDWCDPALAVGNGTVSLSNAGFLGSTATVTCDEFYESNGVSPVCGTDRTWAGVATCTPIDHCSQNLDNCTAREACVEEDATGWSCTPCTSRETVVTDGSGVESCQCSAGWAANSSAPEGCSDIDECAVDADGTGGLNFCRPVGDCVNLEPPVRYTCCPDSTADVNGVRQAFANGTCACPPLTEPTTSGAAGCQDVDECAAGPCGQGEACTNIDCVATTCAGVGYSCACAAGYVDDGSGACVAEDECATQAPCAGGETCTDLDPEEGGFICCGGNSAPAQAADDSWQCACASGYAKLNAGDNACVDFDECTGAPVSPNRRRGLAAGNSSSTAAAGTTMPEANNNVSASSSRAGGSNSSSASASAGASPTSTGELQQPTPTPMGYASCATGQTCENCPGTYQCCDAGYESVDCAACTDIDECADGTDNCAADELCTNTAGSFTCTACGGDGEACCASDTCDTGFSCVMSACQADAVSSSSGAPSPSPGTPSGNNGGGKGKGSSSAALLHLSAALLALLL